MVKTPSVTNVGPNIWAKMREVDKMKTEELFDLLKQAYIATKAGFGETHTNMDEIKIRKALQLIKEVNATVDRHTLGNYVQVVQADRCIACMKGDDKACCWQCRSK